MQRLSSKLFQSTPGFWKQLENHRKYMDYLSKELGIETHSDWYEVKLSDFKKHNGQAFLQQYYNSSPSKALENVFPEYIWHPWLFTQLHKNFWSDGRNQRLYLDWLSEELGIESLDDWYRVTNRTLKQYRGEGLLKFRRNFIQTLQVHYPEYDWISNQKQSSQEKHLLGLLPSVFKDTSIDIRFNYLHPQLIHRSSQKPMQLDFYLPTVGLAFEFQGKQHFVNSHRGNLREQEKRDEEKRRACNELGIKLIEIPYTWDGTADSLIHFIRQVMPQFQPDHQLTNQHTNQRPIYQPPTPKSDSVVTWTQEIDPSGWYSTRLILVHEIFHLC